MKTEGDDNRALQEREIQLEQEAVAAARDAFAELAPRLSYLWHWGDGDGGWLLEELRRAGQAAGALRPPPGGAPSASKRRNIGRTLSRRVFERDRYRCVSCGGWEDLQLDHKHPVSAGGEDTFENLQAMCGPCNRAKGATIP